MIDEIPLQINNPNLSYYFLPETVKYNIQILTSEFQISQSDFLKKLKFASSTIIANDFLQLIFINVLIVNFVNM